MPWRPDRRCRRRVARPTRPTGPQRRAPRDGHPQRVVRTGCGRRPNYTHLGATHDCHHATVQLDEARLNEFVARFITDLGATHHAVTVVIGDRLGLYRALADVGPATAHDVAAAAGCDERYTQEWLNAQAASGYCEFDPDDRPLSPHAGADRLPGRRELTGVPDRRDVRRRVAVQGRGAAHRGDPHRRRLRVGRAPPRSLRRRRAVLPPRLRREPGVQLDPRARRCRGEAAAPA